MPAIISRERFGADRRDLLRVGDILIGQAGADARPCVLELPLAVVEVGAGRTQDERDRLFKAVNVERMFP
jgi:hypothetical protein